MVNKRFAQSKFHRIVPPVVTHGVRFEDEEGVHL